MKKFVKEYPELTYCRSCFKIEDENTHHVAVFIAPQHTRGDIDQPATWIPVCENIMKNWYNEVPFKKRLPYFRIVNGSVAKLK